jgi:hypothetical protein
MKSNLIVEQLSFARQERDAWERGWRKGRACGSFANLRPCFLTEIISDKARVRPKRFFGEAYVAGHWGYDEAWYSSYKWLTSSIWTSGKCPSDKYHQVFHAALQKHFPRLPECQAKARAFAARNGFKPVAPDLWLILDGEHWFIETKIPPDHISDSQLAGLAVIATCLPATKPVHVALVELRESFAGDRRISEDLRSRFKGVCGTLRELRR